eukprot:scaffold6091_cov164-Amphora_coffeaeformis.AAC.20
MMRNRAFRQRPNGIAFPSSRQALPSWKHPYHTIPYHTIVSTRWDTCNNINMNIWNVVFALPSFAFALATRLVECACRSILLLTVAFAICYQVGWFHRLIWFMAEREASKALNGTKVTIGSFDLDLIRGTGWGSNVVVHSPQRHVWKWESPLLARVGKVYVETNLVRVLLSMLLLREEPPLEIYTLHLQDIQVFMERKQQVFNIYLLDPHNVIPEPKFDDDDEENNEKDTNDLSNVNVAISSEDHSGSEEAAEVSTPVEKEKAQMLVDEMIKAVQSLGKAARDGSLPEALQQQRQTVTNRLKELQSKPIKSQAMRDGIKIVQHVSKAVVEKTQTVQKIVQQPDKRQLDNEKIVYARFGRVVMEDLRVFTRSSLTQKGAAEKKKKNNTSETATKSGLANSWNKPIVVEHLAVRPSEFCAPLTVKDEDGLPVLYRPINYCMDAIMKRVVAEMAKSNTGTLLKTAMGEILDFWVEKELQVPPSSSKDQL